MDYRITKKEITTIRQLYYDYHQKEREEDKERENSGLLQKEKKK